MFTPNFIYHIFSKLFYPVDLTSYLIFVQIHLTGSLCFYIFHGQEGQKNPKICFIPYLTTLSIKKQPQKKKKPKVFKDRGAGVGLTVVKDSMVFFNRLLD